jgi:IMP dehydrogenase
MEEKYTFDDVLLSPRYSEVLPHQTSVASYLTKNIKLNIPIVSAAMDRVTEHNLAIELAKQGGIGVIHKNMSIDAQSQEIKKVKKYESWIVSNPITISPEDNLQKVLDLQHKYGYSGMPVVDSDKKLVGILTNRDIRFIKDTSLKVCDIMTKNNLVTVKAGIYKAEALHLLQQHKIERLLVVDDKFCCIGLITVKDIERISKYPNSCKDTKSRLRVAAAVGIAKDTRERIGALISEDVDAIFVDTAHAHTKTVGDLIKKIKREFKVDIIAGNIATKEAAQFLIDAGADGVKVGIGPGSICTTRVIAGVGMPQLSAITDVASVCKKHNIPLIADGGVRYSGDIAKAIAAGASSVMIGSLFAGAKESPGEIVLYKGRSYKSYRGMGSIGAMTEGSADRYFQTESKKLVPEGVEGLVPLNGCVSSIVYQLVGGLKSAMGYTGSPNISEMQKNCRFIRISNASFKEGHPHDIVVTQEAPNYS